MFEVIRSNETLLWWLFGASIVTFFASLIFVPWLIVRIPHDYFSTQPRRWQPWAGNHPLLRGFLMLGKNALGILFVAAGLAMLFLPGQGILTILVGIMFLNFPGKHRFELWLVSRRPVLRSINWLRRRAGRPSLNVEEKSG